MTIEEAIDLLSLAAAYDRRTIGESDAVAWHAALDDIAFGEAQAAVIAHYRDSRDWLMPADVRRRVKAARRDRLDREILPAPDPALTDDAGAYKGALRAAIQRIADGLSVGRALALPPRQAPPPGTVAQALAALPKPPTKQEIAARQASEARALREASDRRKTA